jgi:hypothetical protein
MRTVQILSLLLVLLVGGCASPQVHRGLLIGALSGAALGATTGLVISDEELLGSGSGGPGGDKSLPQGGSVMAGLAVGLVAGAVVGAMAGHGGESAYEKKKKVLPPPPPTGGPVDAPLDTPPDTAAEPQARAPYLRGL